jgi:pimeloyl-ACP methyl ester carboxylesterase
VNEEKLQLRIYGDASLPTLIYLPGLHGDWTLVGGFRKHLQGKVRFVEFTYPRTLKWSLDDYAANIETALAKNNITTGWLLGESFSSQVVWPLIARGNFPAQGIILAGGFVKHPMRWIIRLTQNIFGSAALSFLVWAMYGFTKFVRCCFRLFQKSRPKSDEFAARRTELDSQSAVHRLHLIARNDPREIVRATQLPAYYISGFIDPIVPWFLVKNWLRKNCPSLRATKIIILADHNILGTGARQAAAQILTWLNA